MTYSSIENKLILMKKILNLIFLMSCFASASLRAQQIQTIVPRVLKVASSKQGNYIYLAGREEIVGSDTAFMRSTDHFIIKRMPYVMSSDSIKVKAALKNLKTIGNAKRVTTEQQLKAIFSDTDIGELKTSFKKKSTQEVVDFLTGHVKAIDYGLAYGIIEMKIAMGHVYFDADVKEGEVVYYHVTRVDKNNVEHPWGFALAQGKVGNYALQYLKPIVSEINSSDSTVNISWKLQIAGKGLKAFPKPKTLAAFDPEGKLQEVPFPLTNLGGKVVALRSRKPVSGLRVMGQVNAAGDTITFHYDSKINKEEEFSAYLMPEDEIYNQGAPSDLAVAFGVDERNTPVIGNLRLKEIPNGIRLSWSQLPAKAYITGIEVARYDSEDHMEKLGILSALDTSYTDNAIKVGQHYRYHVKILFMPGTGIEQGIPAQAAGSYTLFSKPLPPHNLSAKAEGDKITLNWDLEEDPGFYGFFVYRGTSPNKMDLIAGPIKEKKYVDTAESLSGRSQYYYAVKNQNLRQDTSLHTEPVMVKSARKILIDPPADVLFYYANGKLRIDWADTRMRDNFIESFVLQKRKKGDAEYTTLPLKTKNDAFYVDSLINRGFTYQYRVASVGANGEISAYSNAGEFSLKKEAVATVGLFYARNITAGVEVSLPEVIYDERKAYQIYRRNANGGAFAKIGAMNADTFIFTDEKVESGQTYIYSIRVTDKADREGEMGLSVSVKR